MTMNVFLLIGQSNMAGRGPLHTVPAISRPDIRMYRAGQWVAAVEPLHADKPEAGIGLGMSFAATLLDRHPGVPVGLVPCAVGATPLQRWMPDGDLFAAAVATARDALADGRPAGILWHQGERDSQHPADAASYGERLVRMIESLRSALWAPLVPFVAGELGGFLAGHETCRACFREVNDQLRGLCGRVPRYGCARAAGLADKGDRVHFDSAALREFGRRYADVFTEITGDSLV